jgi:hypothetical protein
MGAAGASEMSVNFHRTNRAIFQKTVIFILDAVTTRMSVYTSLNIFVVLLIDTGLRTLLLISIKVKIVITGAGLVLQLATG